VKRHFAILRKNTSDTDFVIERGLARLGVHFLKIMPLLPIIWPLYTNQPVIGGTTCSNLPPNSS
jgi:hypothetical protein